MVYIDTHELNNYDLHYTHELNNYGLGAHDLNNYGLH